MAVRAAEPVVDAPSAGQARGGGTWPLLVLPAVAMAVLGGLFVARRHGFWYDELYTAEVVPLSLRQLFEAVVRGEGPIPYLRDAPPSYNGPYYAAAHVWLAVTGLRADEMGLRLLSWLAAVGGVVAFTAAAVRLAGRRAGLVAGLIVATNPFVVQFAAEARGYALAFLATSLAALGLARELDGARHGLVLFGVAGAVAGLFHWFALPAIGGLAVAAVVLRGRSGLPVLAVAAGAAIPALGLVAVALLNGVGSSGAEWIRGVGLGVPRLYVRAWTGGHVPLVVATVVAAGAGVVRGSRRSRPARVVAACWVGVPVVLVTAVELVRPVYVDRYLLPSAVGLALLMALGTTHLARPAAVAAASAAVVAAGVAGTMADLRKPPKDDVRTAVETVAARHQAGEPIVTAARWDALGVDHYARRDHPEVVPDMVLPPASVPDASTVWVVRRARGGVKGDADKLESLDRELAGRGLAPAEELRFEGRYADVLVQRWARG